MELVTEQPINPSEMYDQIEKQTAGSVVFHYAVVRERTGDQITTGITFERGGDIESELRGIIDKLKSEWPIEDAFIVRRLGALAVGDIISLVACAAPNRKPAFEACLHGVECLKKMTTIVKTEK